MSAIMLLH